MEKAFLENFLLAPYGDGVGAANNFFPEVYPASKLPGAPAITTWSFWLMLELAEYVERSGDLELALTHQKRVEDFVAGSARYIGESGLLQDMPFVFIDWSQSNHPQNTLPISTAANAGLSSNSAIRGMSSITFLTSSVSFCSNFSRYLHRAVYCGVFSL